MLVALGLPVAIGLAWAFDVVPDDGPRARSGSEAGHALDHPLQRPPAVFESSGGAEARRRDWARIQELFIEALAQDADGREAFLRTETGGDERLRAEVRSLLEAHAGQGALDRLEARVVAPLRDASSSSEAESGGLPVGDLDGSTIGRYEVKERLGGGGMGVVYRARDTRLGRSVALKFLSAHLLSSPEAKRRFLAEAQAIARLDHPNLCTIHEIGEADEGLLFIAMTYYEGETLKDRLRRGRLPFDEALSIAECVASGLAHAAEAGIIHRDIKPDNLILTTDGGVRIVDFGIAKMLDDDVTRAGARLGTVAYMSPEQTRGEEVDERTDVWSLGVVIWEMLAGERPFRGGSDQAVVHAILNETPPPLAEAAPGTPPAVVTLVEAMMRKERMNRPDGGAGVVELITALRENPSGFNAVPALTSISSEGERRLVTALSCTIEGLDTLMDTVGLEEVDARVAEIRDLARVTIGDFGGMLNEFSEHGFMALFGVPVAHEDDALRAVRAALHLHRHVPGDGALVLRSAVGAGQVAIQAVEDPTRSYRLGGGVTRDVVRLAATAGPGDVLLSRELVRSVAPFVKTEEREPVELSPGAAPVVPVAVTGEADVDSRLDAVAEGGLTRFVGRTDELQTLLSTLGRVDRGAGLVASVVGDAGVGKSRLLHEFRTTLAEQGVRYIQGRCRPDGAFTPFLPFIDCVKAILGTGRTPPGKVHDQVVARTQALAAELEVYAPILLHVLSIESDEHPLPDYLEGEDLRAAVAEALVSVFTLGCRGQPLVLFLEDWHWADGGSEDALAQLAEMAAAYPLLIVVTARPEADGYTAPPRGHVHLDLTPLDPDAATEVMRAALGGLRVEADLAELVSEKTGGNPFFIEELCHTLLETGSVSTDDGEAVLAGEPGDLAIPDTVQAVLKTRIDRLDPESREVLRTASVIGREFGRELLGRVVPSSSRLGGALDALRASGLIQRTSLVPEPLYRLKHALTRDVSYDSLLERQRRDRHALVGRAMEELYENRTEEFAEQLSTHFSAAEDWVRAVHYGFAAAERAASLWRIAEAVSALERTRAWLDRREDGRQDRDPDLVRLLLAQERHSETLGRRDEQARLIAELHELVEGEASPERSIVLVREGELATLRGDFAGARQAFGEAMDVAEAGGSTEEHTLALRGLGHAFWRAGRYDLARSPLETVVARDREVLDQDSATVANRTTLLRDLINLGRVLRELGEWDQAGEIGDEARELAEETGNPVDFVYVSNYMGHLYRAMGRPEEAIREFRRGSEGFGRAQLPVRHSFHLLAQAALHLEMGQVDEGLETYENAVDLSRRAGRADNLANALILQSDALASVGRATEAVPVFEEAVSILRNLGTDSTLVAALRKLAAASEAAAPGEVGIASVRARWAEARALAEQIGDDRGILESSEREARLLADEPQTARELFRNARAAAGRLSDTRAAGRVLNSLALLEFRAGDTEAAAEYFRSAVEALTDESEGGEEEPTTAIGPACPDAFVGPKRHASEDEDLDAELLLPVLNGWGAALVRLGREDEAIEVLTDALALAESTDADARRGDALAALGSALRARGELAAAYDRYEHCRDARRAAGDRAGEGWALLRLAEVTLEAGSPDRARKLADEAAAVAGEVEDGRLQDLASDLVDSHDDEVPTPGVATADE
ncbi:MAG TPA: protein kinase [Longimicrobiales bacterium]|nr:protein kinase [Longimicrobiales bacterium]